MENTNKISIEQCCVYYNIETTFVHQLDEFGLIELSRSEKEVFIAFEQLSNLEKYMHMHYDLEINMQGIEAIKHLLDRVELLQLEVRRLQNQLR